MYKMFRNFLIPQFHFTKSITTKVKNVKKLGEEKKICKIKQITPDKIGHNLTLKGWVQNLRKMKNDFFFDIDDGSSCKTFQIIIPKVQGNKLSIGQSVEVDGILQETPKKQLELKASNLKIIGECNISDGIYPFTPKQVPNPEYVRDYLHMRSHVNYMRSIFRIRHHLFNIIHNYMNDNDFLQINTPILTSNDCEGAGEIFVVKPDNNILLKSMNKPDIPIDESYFDKKTFLSVSGQLHLEAMCHGLGNTYTLGPAFRAENNKSPIHLSEFYMFEAELAFCDRIEILIEFIERFIKDVSKKILDKCEDDIKNCGIAINYEKMNENFDFLNKDFKIIEYGETLRILAENREKLKTELNPENGLSKEQELFLVEKLNSPMFVINWPKTMKPFYMRRIDNDPFKVSGLDLLMPRVGELVGGSLREDNYEELEESINPGLEWYLDLRKYGNIPTGGFGLGIERFLQLITGIKNIRDVIHFPRYPHNCKM